MNVAPRREPRIVRNLRGKLPRGMKTGTEAQKIHPVVISALPPQVRRTLKSLGITPQKPWVREVKLPRFSTPKEQEEFRRSLERSIKYIRGVKERLRRLPPEEADYFGHYIGNALNNPFAVLQVALDKLRGE